MPNRPKKTDRIDISRRPPRIETWRIQNMVVPKKTNPHKYDKKNASLLLTPLTAKKRKTKEKYAVKLRQGLRKLRLRVRPLVMPRMI
jgi:hypothetical protein